MAYLSFSLHTKTEQQVSSFDFTPQEFIPLVRHTTRTLAWQYGHLREPLKNYRAVIKPLSNTSYSELETVMPDPSRTTHETSQRLAQIKDTLSLRSIASLGSELSAFNNPGTSGMCQRCPENHRCIGSGASVGEEALEDWIDLDVAEEDDGRRVYHFRLTLLTHQNQIIYRRVFPLTVLESFIKLIHRRYASKNPHALNPENATLHAHMYAHYWGQPSLSPLLQEIRSSATRQSVASMRDSSSTSSVIDWDEVDSSDDVDKESSLDLEINIVSEEELDDEHIQKSPPGNARYIKYRESLDGDLQVYIERGILQSIFDTVSKASHFAGGFLVGDVFNSKQDSNEFVEIVGAIALPEIGTGNLVMGRNVWARSEDAIRRTFPDKRIVGWFRSHVSPVEIFSVDETGVRRDVSSDFELDPSILLELHEEEYFLHQHFFPKPWQVGLVISPRPKHARFYNQRDDLVIACAGHHVFDGEGKS